MTILTTPLTERHLFEAEKETGQQFAPSFREFLLKDKIILMDDEAPIEFQIVPRSVFYKNYRIVNTLKPTGYLAAERV